ARLVTVDNGRYSRCVELDGQRIGFDRHDFGDAADFQTDVDGAPLADVDLDLVLDILFEIRSFDAHIINAYVNIADVESAIVIGGRGANDKFLGTVGLIHRGPFDCGPVGVLNRPYDRAGDFLR